MSGEGLIDKYYGEGNELRDMVVRERGCVGDKGLWIGEGDGELCLERDFVYEGGMLEDIGILVRDGEGIYWFGEKGYMCDGYLGGEVVGWEGYGGDGLVCERDRGGGVGVEDIIGENVGVGEGEMVGVSMEEEVVCFGDKFYWKRDVEREKSVEKGGERVVGYGKGGVEGFDYWCKVFL